jgi:hypothetical protein
MPIQSANKLIAWETKQAVEAAYIAGAPQRGVIGSHQPVKSAYQIAADVLKVSERTVRDRCSINGLLERNGLKVDWKKPGTEQTPSTGGDVTVEVDIATERARQSTQDELGRLRKQVRASHREALTEDIIREKLLGLAAEPLRPPSWSITRTARGKAQEAVILMLSDLHWGEVINLDAMGGRNSFNMDIAHKRLQRYFSHVCELGTEHWVGPPPAIIYLWLGGDMISGEIHEELAKTNDLLAIPSVKDLSDHLVAGIDLLLCTFKCDIRVLSTPGNHGRDTKKPESKGFAVNSYDTLVMWMLERWYLARNEKRVSFSAPRSGDAFVTINGWNILFTHGDRIGSKGNMGFVGPAATAARGMKKLVQDYAAEGSIVDMIAMGHLHTGLELEEGFVNPSFSGPSEYSRSGRFRSKPAAQWMLTVHPRRCPARRWLVDVGAPEEGSLYKERSSG